MYADELLKKKGGLFNLKIVLADAFDPEVPEERAMIDELKNPETNDPYYIVLRELTSTETVEYMDAEDKARTSMLATKLQDMIVDHNFIKSDGKPADNGAIYKILVESGSLLLYVLEIWGKRLPLARRMQKASNA